MVSTTRLRELTMRATLPGRLRMVLLELRIDLLDPEPKEELGRWLQRVVQAPLSYAQLSVATFDLRDVPEELRIVFEHPFELGEAGDLRAVLRVRSCDRGENVLGGTRYLRS